MSVIPAFFLDFWYKYLYEYIGIWEQIHNPHFNYGEFATIKNKSGLNSFKISVGEFVEKTNAMSLHAKAGRYGGTYAHKDIAFQFAMWISPEFQIYIVKEFQRLKNAEQQQIGWSAKRELAKINYHIHTDAVKQNLIPKELTPKQAAAIYADEADVLNVALFGMTAKEWRTKNDHIGRSTGQEALKIAVTLFSCKGPGGAGRRGAAIFAAARCSG